MNVVGPNSFWKVDASDQRLTSGDPGLPPNALTALFTDEAKLTLSNASKVCRQWFIAVVMCTDQHQKCLIVLFLRSLQNDKALTKDGLARLNVIVIAAPVSMADFQFSSHCPRRAQLLLELKEATPEALALVEAHNSTPFTFGNIPGIANCLKDAKAAEAMPVSHERDVEFVKICKALLDLKANNLLMGYIRQIRAILIVMYNHRDIDLEKDIFALCKSLLEKNMIEEASELAQRLDCYEFTDEISKEIMTKHTEVCLSLIERGEIEEAMALIWRVSEKKIPEEGVYLDRRGFYKSVIWALFDKGEIMEAERVSRVNDNSVSYYKFTSAFRDLRYQLRLECRDLVDKGEYKKVLELAGKVRDDDHLSTVCWGLLELGRIEDVRSLLPKFSINGSPHFRSEFDEALKMLAEESSQEPDAHEVEDEEKEGCFLS